MAEGLFQGLAFYLLPGNDEICRTLIENQDGQVSHSYVNNSKIIPLSKNQEDLNKSKLTKAYRTDKDELQDLEKYLLTEESDEELIDQLQELENSLKQTQQDFGNEYRGEGSIMSFNQSPLMEQTNLIAEGSEEEIDSEDNALIEQLDQQINTDTETINTNTPKRKRTENQTSNKKRKLKNATKKNSKKKTHLTQEQLDKFSAVISKLEKKTKQHKNIIFYSLYINSGNIPQAYTWIQNISKGSVTDFDVWTKEEDETLQAGDRDSLWNKNQDEIEERLSFFSE